jgi:FkbM family methyltransferase
MAMSKFLIRLLNTKNMRWLLKRLIFLRYKQKGNKIQRVEYLEEFDAWEFRINGVSYLSSGPGWAYDYEYLKEQLENLSAYAYLPKTGDFVIDIGAGVGEETNIFSKLVGPTGKVYAIEAHPRTFKALQYLVEVNMLKNVVCSNSAMSDKAGTVEIEDSGNSLGNSILQVSTGKTISIPAETFDEFVSRNNIQRIDLVKMNVEGAEQLIIKGMAKSLSRIRHMAISCHDFRYKQGESEFFKTKQIVSEFLLSNKFIISTQSSSINMVDDYVYAANPAFQK